MSRPPTTRRDGRLWIGEHDLETVADRFGTPCYLYARQQIEANWRAYAAALDGVAHRICYAVKANGNLAVLNILARLGSGFDIVSGGELARVLAAGGDPAGVVFSGVGKRAEEMEAALEAGIGCFNVESAAELARLEAVAASHGCRAPLSLRVNPDVDAGTHPYISTGLRENKFGIPVEEAVCLYHQAAASPHLEVIGIDCHIGSQITRIDPFLDALERILALVERLRGEGIALHHIDVGGGLGVRYQDETPPSPATFAAAIAERVAPTGLQLLIEPGRSVVADAGLLLTRVEYLKENEGHRFIIVDAAMNDLMRPALYGAWQAIEPVVEVAGREARVADVVGPVCETGDFLGKQRSLAVVEGDLLAVFGAGAYGFSMSSNYNSRPRAAEVVVDGSELLLARPRESVAALFADEVVPSR